MNLFDFVSEYAFAFSIYGILLSVVSLVLVIINTIKTSNIIRKYKRLMRGVDNKNFEALLEHYLTSMRSSLVKVDEMSNKQAIFSAQLNKCLQGVGMVRYNPFDDMGSDLSFSLALLDAYSNGVVITCLFGRQSSSTYSKSITNGKSTYQLSAEEIESIKIAKASLSMSN